MPTKPCPICKGAGVIDVPIGERIKALRDGAGESQETLAKVIGLSRPALANIEAGKQDVTTDRLVILSRHFGVSADHLLGLDDE